MRYDSRSRYRVKPPSKPPSVFANLALILTGGGLMLVVLILLGVWQSSGQLLGQVGTLFRLNAPPPSPKVDVRSLVVQQVRNVSELTTAVFTMEAVVPASQDATFGGLVVGTTKLLYIAYGEVRAGVDLSQLKPEDVQVTDNGLYLRLPPPQLLDSKIDVNRSTVYDYNRGVLNLGPDSAPQLQKLAQQEALKKITAAACDNKLMQQASDRAKLAVTQLLTTSGHTQVTVEVPPPSPSACVVPTTAPPTIPGN